MTASDTYQLKWHSHSSHLNGSVASLLRSDRFTDVVLCTLEGGQIPAHKFILGSCSIFLSNLFESQRMVMRDRNNLLYIVLPPEITTKALQILVEYMYKGETTVSNEILDMVLKSGEILKIRGLWRHSEKEDGAAETSSTTVLVQKKPEDQSVVQKVVMRTDDGNFKQVATNNFGQVQPGNQNKPMFIGPPKLVFIRTGDGAGVKNLRQIAPKPSTIVVTPMEKGDTCPVSIESAEGKKGDRASSPKVLNKKADKKYGKRAKVNDEKTEEEKKADAKAMGAKCEVPLKRIKEEPEWNENEDDSEERPLSNLFHTEMNIKCERDDVSVNDAAPEQAELEEEQMYSPLTCELCSEVFTLPAEWVRHIMAHADAGLHITQRRDDSEETALLRCDLCQKHFASPAQWVRHIQSTHTEKELALSNQSEPHTRHNRFTEGVQNKCCPQCNKHFPSHASMVIHLRTHTGERPFICGLCNKGFNVKSNLLRHLRTLHDQMISPDDMEEEITPP